MVEMRRLLILTALCVTLTFAQKYNGPRPPRRDLPYLLHASRLVATEQGEAQEQRHKDESTYVVEGASSLAKTPLAEPIFLLEADQINPERMEMYKFEVRNAHRELTISPRHRRTSSKPIHLSVTRLDGKLYRIEVNEMLENGEYSLSPSDSNRVFCFSIY